MEFPSNRYLLIPDAASGRLCEEAKFFRAELKQHLVDSEQAEATPRGAYCEEDRLTCFLSARSVSHEKLNEGMDYGGALRR